MIFLNAGVSHLFFFCFVNVVFMGFEVFFYSVKYQGLARRNSTPDTRMRVASMDDSQVEVRSLRHLFECGVVRCWVRCQLGGSIARSVL